MRAVPSSVVLLLLALTWIQPATAQQASGSNPETPLPDPNAVYLEVFGNGGLFSLNYERMVSPNVGFRAGFANWTTSGFWGDGESSFLVFPLTLSRLPGGRGSGWEWGAGFLVGRVKDKEPDFGFGGGSDEETSSIVNLTGILGYRWVSEGGWLFRLGFTPFYSLSGDYPEDAFFPSAGLSLGKTF